MLNFAKCCSKGRKTKQNGKTSPAFLHANSTSHTWCFSAIAEIIDNAYDPDVSASKLFIDKTVIGGESCLIFTDNGYGLDAEKLHRMLSFGYCEKVEIQGHKPVGHYGNGFKSGSMRLGRDAMVFTKHTHTRSVGFLSQNFLKKVKADTVLVPILTFEKNSNRPVVRHDTGSSLKAITEYSLLKSQEAILREFDHITSDTGTRIIIYDLKRGNDGKLELDFESNPKDIINSEHQALDFSTTYRPVREYIPLYKQSLREYCSILFLKPRMQIIIRDHKVKTKLVSKSLSRTEKDVYKPVWLDKPIKIIFGFGHSDKDYGMMLYNKNRLIKAYEKVGYQKSGDGKGQGVVGVVSVDFLEPIHNKQDFNKDDRYNSCMNALGCKLNDYWVEKDNRTVTVGDVMIIEPSAQTNLPDWTWAQCDNCLKWRRLPDGFSDKDLPEKWYCYLNSDPVHSRCDVEEEPEDEDELLMRATYQKTVKHKQQKEKAQKRFNLEHKERLLDKKEQELKNAAQQLQQQLHHSISQGPDNHATAEELMKAKVALRQAKDKEQQQELLILQLRRQAQHVNAGVLKARETMKAKSQPAPKRKSTDTSDSASAHKKKKVPMEFDGFMVTQNDCSSSSSSENEGEKKKGKKSTGDGDIILIDSDDEVQEWNKRKKGKLPKVSLGGKKKNISGTEPDDNEKDVKPKVSELDAAIHDKASTSAANNNEKWRDESDVKEEKPDIDNLGMSATNTGKGHIDGSGDSKDKTSDMDHAEDVKPDVDDFGAGLDITNVTSVNNDGKESTSAATKSKSSPGKKSSKTSSSQSTKESSAKKKVCVHKAVQTTARDDLSSSGSTAEIKKDLEQTKKQLSSLRKNVSDLLKVLVPELEVKDLSFVDDIVVEMIKVNSQENGETCENGKKSNEAKTKEINGASSSTKSPEKTSDLNLVAEIKEESGAS